MGDCSNFECINHTWGDKIRCSKCRHAKLYTCSDCGRELDNNRKIRCKSCSNDIKKLRDDTWNKAHADMIMARRRINYPRIRDNCIVCGSELPKSKNKFCTDECFTVNRKAVLKKRKQLNKTSTEILS
jgi:DNA-directed RNA polymerase subunit RPC12/RpoP/predicted nucleic acid-binding Zn ribbon protein